LRGAWARSWLPEGGCSVPGVKMGVEGVRLTFSSLAPNLSSPREEHRSIRKRGRSPRQRFCSPRKPSRSPRLKVLSLEKPFRWGRKGVRSPENLSAWGDFVLRSPRNVWRWGRRSWFWALKWVSTGGLAWPFNPHEGAWLSLLSGKPARCLSASLSGICTGCAPPDARLRQGMLRVARV
jgi:hypothetical protein